MQIFDFINQDELDELPEDENAAFVEFVRIARVRLQERLSSLNGNNDNDWDAIQDARHGFVNCVTATARQLKIEPFASMDVPRIKELDYEDYRQFIADVDYYLNQMLFTVRSASRRESVALSEEARTSIRTKLYHLREAIEKSDYDVRTRARLRARLDEFEIDLDKRRINYVAIARFAVEVLALPGALSASYDVTAKLVNQIMHTVGNEKINEDERRRMPPLEKPAALIPPRVEEKKKSDTELGRGFSRDLDDEIPF